MRRVSCPSSRRLGLPLALVLVVGGLLAVGVAGPANAATTLPADGTYISCSGTAAAPTAPYYVMVGGAPILMTLANMPKPNTVSGTPTAADDVTYHSNCSTLFPSPKVPANGTFIQGYKAHKATGSIYEIVKGAPITVTGWSHVKASGSGKVIAVDVNAIPASTATTDTTKSGSTTLHGYLHARVPSGATFAGFDTTTKKPSTYYKVDSGGHPVPQAVAVSGPVVDQTSINACERMTCDPVGDVEPSSPAYGVLHLEGYAMDFPQATSANIQFLVDQTSTYTIPANRPDSYAPAGAAGNHDFSWDLPIAAGTHEVCATVIGTTPGKTTQALGCSYPTVIGAKPGKVKKVRLKAKGHGKVQVKWKPVKANGNPITTYLLKCSGSHRKQLSGAKTKKILKHQHAGRRLSCKVRAVSGGSSGGYGKWSKKSKTVTVR